MPAREFGLAASSVAVMQLLNAVLALGLGTAVQRAYAGDRGEEDARRLVTLAIVLSLGGGLVAYGTGRWWCPLVGLGPFPVVIRYAVLWSVMSAITGPALSLVRSKDQLGWFVAASFAQSLFAQLLALGLVAMVSGTATEYILGQLIGQVVTVAIVVAVARPKPISVAHRKMLTGSLKFSAVLVPALIAGFLMDASDRLVIQGDLGSAQLGRYAVARNIGGFAIVMLGLLDFVWLPRLFSIKDRAVRRQVLATSRDGLYILTTAFAVAIAAASPLLLAIWSPPSYHPESLRLITALVAATAIPAATGLVYAQAMILDGRTKILAGLTVGGALLNLSLNLLLVPSLGIDGSAGILLAGGVGSVFISHRIVGRSGPQSNPRSMVIAVSGAAVCIGSAAVPGHGIALAFRLLVAFAAATVFATRLITLAWPATGARLAARLPRLQSLLTGD
jgi:O-antigen/teichoic acid export membrane protein